jgi:predicted Zn-dependent protease
MLGVPGEVISPLVGMGQGAAVASYSRTQEEDADITGFQYLTGAGWNAAEGARSFAVLARLYGDNAGFFSSHPSSSSRQAQLTRMARAQGGKGRINAETYLRQTERIRREVLAELQRQGRDREAAQLSRNLRAAR